jgi:N-acetylglucosamine-6-phosphate deacetylase
LTSSKTNNSRTAIIGNVVTTDSVIENGIVLIEDDRIAFVGKAEDAQPEPNSAIIEAKGKFVLPGLIDTHVHGSHGDDVMSAGVEGIKRISKSQLRYGVTGYLPTTLSGKHEDLLRALEECVKAETNPDPAAEIIGIHVEGPFINPQKKGAQPESGIREPNLDQCKEYLRAAPGRVKMMTLAPELPEAMELIQLLTQNNVIASLGHSEADYDTALAAIEAGATHATHLFNAMPAMHHRKPNLTLACLLEPSIRAEIIVDGIHVSQEMVRVAARMKGRDGLALITDGIEAVGLPDGIYTLGDSKVKVEHGVCTLLDGSTIAGSTLTMNRAIGNAVNKAGLSLIDAVYMASTLPAHLCGVEGRKGSLEVGKEADIAILNSDFSVNTTIRNGRIVYQENI